MTQNGKVIALDGGMAVVAFERSEACQQCRACSFGRKQSVEVPIVNTCGARVGDTVSVELHGGEVAKASAVLYVFPLALFLLGLWLAPKLQQALGIGMNAELFACLCALALTAAAFLVVRLTERKRAMSKQFSPRMTDVIAPEGGRDAHEA